MDNITSGQDEAGSNFAETQIEESVALLQEIADNHGQSKAQQDPTLGTSGHIDTKTISQSAHGISMLS